MITNEVIFFDNQTVPSLSDFLYNVNDGTLILQVEGSASSLNISVFGNPDLTDEKFVQLRVINASTYEVTDNITSTGVYWIDINGIRKSYVQINSISGSVKVTGLTKSGLTTDLVARAMAAGSQGGTTDYAQLTNKPSINGIELNGNKTSAEIKVASDVAISNVSYEGSTGILTFTRENGEEFTIDLPLELLIKSGRYDEATKSIILVLANGDTISINVEDLISVYGSDGTTIEMYVQDGVNTFKIADAIIEKINNAANPDNETIVLNANSKLEAVGIRDVKTAGVDKFWTGTKAEYDALATKDENVFYAITDDSEDGTSSGVELTGEFSDGTLSVSLLNENGEQFSQTSILVSGVAYNIASTQNYASTTFSFESDVLTQFGKIVNKNLDKEFVVYITDTNDATFRFETHYKTPSADSTGNTGTLYGIGVSAGYRERIKIFTTTYNIVNGEYVFTSIAFNNNTSKVALEQNVITRANTEAYTPSADYHPSTKLYTDKTHYENMTGYDATATQVLKNVNGTLTWVTEG